MKSLIGHTEQLIFLVHRTEEGDRWVLMESEFDDRYDIMRDNVANDGGKLYRVIAKSIVITEEDITDA